MTAYDRALKLLAMREHSAKEIECKLAAKGYDDTEIAETISKLISENSLSDRRFAYAYVRSRMRRNPEGRPILRMRLREKGVASDIVETVLSEFWDDEEYLPFLRSYADGLVAKKGHDGARAMLLRKGFRDSEIRATMQEE